MMGMMLWILASDQKMPWEKNVYNRNKDIESNGRRFQGTPSEVTATMRSLVKAQEE